MRMGTIPAVTASESPRMCRKTSGCGSTNTPRIGSWSDASTRSSITARVKITAHSTESCGHLGIETGLEGGEHMRDFPGERRSAEREKAPFRLAELPLPTSAVTAHASELGGCEMNMRDVGSLPGS